MKYIRVYPNKLSFEYDSLEIPTPYGVLDKETMTIYYSEKNTHPFEHRVDAKKAYYKSVDGSIISFNVGDDNATNEYDFIGIIQSGNNITSLKLSGNPALLKSLYLPDSEDFKSFGGTGTFAGNYGNLEYVKLPNTLEYIDSYTFLWTGLTSINIPDSVTSLGANVFYNCRNLSSVVIGDSVESLGEQTFYQCTSLTSVVIGDSVKGIDSLDFYGCASLPSIVLGDSIEYINSNAFNGCTSLTSVTFGNSVTYIGMTAFQGCTSLTSIEFGDSVESIDSAAFFNCSSLSSIDFGNSPASIGSAAFSNCTSLTSIDFGNSVTFINSAAFSNCSSLSSIDFGDSPTRIGSNAFQNCSSLTSIDFGSSVEYIESNAFKNCSSLEDIKLPNSLTVIGDGAFSGANLTSIEIPESLTSIGSGAFGANTIKEVVWNPEILNPSVLNSCGLYTVESLELGDSVTSISSYFSSLPLLTSVVIGEGVTKLNSSQFSNNYSLSSVVIKGDLTEIPDQCFGYMGTGCEHLESFDIPDSVISIGSNAFSGCKSLTSIEIPENCTYIGTRAFYQCHSLTSLEIPSSVTTIGEIIIGYNSSLKELVIPATVTKITSNAAVPDILAGLDLDRLEYNASSIPIAGSYSFQGCSIKELELGEGVIVGKGTESSGYSNQLSNRGLEKIIMHDGVVLTGAGNIFSGNTNLTCVILPNDLTSIPSGTFSACGNLTSINIPSTLEYVGANAFSSVPLEYFDAPSMKLFANSALQGIGSITYITLPESLTKIGRNAFQYCSGLTSIAIPSNCTYIGEYAFSGCTSVTSITLSSSLTKIESANGDSVATVFAGCSSDSLNIPDSLTSIASYAGVCIFSSIKGLNTITVGANNTVYDSRNNCNALIDTEYNRLMVASNNTIIPNDILSIFKIAFSRCTSITSVTIPANCTSIGGDAFRGCDSITEFVVDSNNIMYSSGNNDNVLLRKVNGTFSYLMQGFATSTIPSSVKVIESKAFYDCKGLTSITIPSSVTSIANDAFSGCTNLTAIYYEGSATSNTLWGATNAVLNPTDETENPTE